MEPRAELAEGPLPSSSCDDVDVSSGEGSTPTMKKKRDKCTSLSDGDGVVPVTSTRRRSETDVESAVYGVFDVTQRRRSPPTSRYSDVESGAGVSCYVY